MDNSTNKAKLDDFKSLLAFVSCQHTIFKKLIKKREREKQKEEKTPLPKYQAADVLN